MSELHTLNPFWPHCHIKLLGSSFLLFVSHIMKTNKFLNIPTLLFSVLIHFPRKKWNKRRKTQFWSSHSHSILTAFRNLFVERTEQMKQNRHQGKGNKSAHLLSVCVRVWTPIYSLCLVSFVLCDCWKEQMRCICEKLHELLYWIEDIVYGKWK